MGTSEIPPRSRADLLDGWKEISAYLGRDTRTCQRWESEFGLPAHRIDPQSNRAKVFAYRSELEEWRNSKLRNGARAAGTASLERTARRRLSAILIVAAVVIFIPVLWLVFSGSPSPTSFKIVNSSLAFYGRDDRRLWEIPIESSEDVEGLYALTARQDGIDPRKRPYPNRVAFKDIDGDGKNEVAAFLFHENPAERKLALFDHNGSQMWEAGFVFPYAYAEPIAPDYAPQYIRLQDINGDGRPEVLALWIHQSKRFPSSFVAYDLAGNEFIHYAHTGILHFYEVVENTNGKGTRIYLGGTNNLLNKDGVLAVLNGMIPGRGLGPPYEIPPDLLGLRGELHKYVPAALSKPAMQERYLRFKRHNLTPPDTSILNVTDVLIGDWDIEVAVNYFESMPILFNFNSDFRLRSINLGIDFRRTYEKRLAEGTLKASLEAFTQECLESVFNWSAGNWEALGGLSQDGSGRPPSR